MRNNRQKNAGEWCNHFVGVTPQSESTGLQPEMRFQKLGKITQTYYAMPSVKYAVYGVKYPALSTTSNWGGADQLPPVLWDRQAMGRCSISRRLV